MSRSIIILILFSLFLIDLPSDDTIVEALQFTPSNHTPLTTSEMGQLERAEWFDLMHGSQARGTWKKIEYHHQMAIQSAQKWSPNFKSNCLSSATANNKIIGQWIERGSSNQSGSVLKTNYLPQEDEIWLISDGGTLWKGDRSGNQWTVVNETIRFDGSLLYFIQHDDRFRILTLINEIPHYSEDNGLTWKPARGLTLNQGGQTKDPIVFNKGFNNYFFILAQSEDNANVQLYRSNDDGSEFNAVLSLAETSLDQVKLMQPHFSEDLFLIKKSPDHEGTQLIKVDIEENTLISLSNNEAFKFFEAPLNLEGWKQDTLYHFYSYNTFYDQKKGRITSQLFYSKDKGINWEFRSTLPHPPWEVGLFIDPNHPEKLYYGEVECFVSSNEGKNWALINPWREYYKNPDLFLHADVMNFGAFETEEGVPFMLVGHHGGLHVSYDGLSTLKNISLDGLNISQYYSVKSLDDLIVAGSQDQGLQWANGNSDEILPFDQKIIGDFGHLTFTNDQSALWAVYPGGIVAYISDIPSGNFDEVFQLGSPNRTVWLPPIVENPLLEEDAVLLAGGSITERDSGSFLINISHTGNGNLEASAFNYDFHFHSNGGHLSALAISPIAPSLWYAATDNGYFFVSENAGSDWSKNESFVLEGAPIYGQVIHPSAINPNIVYFGGSGYSNDPLFISNTKGQHFTSLSQGLPPTLIYDLVADEGEEIFFAATESGPYCYLKEDETWYPLNSGCAPNQSYWSVEWLQKSRTVRFGTFGRGIWDFKIDQLTSTTNSLVRSPILVFPNPTVDQLKIDLQQTFEGISPIKIKIFNQKGQIVFLSELVPMKQVHTLDISELASGHYFLSIQQNKTQYAHKFLKVSD